MKRFTAMFLACVIPGFAQPMEPNAGKWKTWIISSAQDFRGSATAGFGYYQGGTGAACDKQGPCCPNGQNGQREVCAFIYDQYGNPIGNLYCYWQNCSGTCGGWCVPYYSDQDYTDSCGTSGRCSYVY